MLVMASSLSPTNMAESYCALLSASWRQSRRNFSMFGCEEDMATPRFLEAILIIGLVRLRVTVRIIAKKAKKSCKTQA